MILYYQQMFLPTSIGGFLLHTSGKNVGGNAIYRYASMLNGYQLGIIVLRMVCRSITGTGEQYLDS